MMSRIEPRAAAYGERLWRGPETGGWLEAERRLVRHRWALWAACRDNILNIYKQLIQQHILPHPQSVEITLTGCRERLVQRGVAAETLTHGWCRQHEGRCAVREGLNTDTFF